ncbi:JmjC domain, hydroxylase [Nesidiocoris tenuis]|uniref:Jumonji domain-containing protein 4 n=1 Tax=Nesidiocoris tenuis TaxID=355587 RepID=A0ABN7AB39_9HEMI|nr:JmjC domain, hydroxylase [Nesidiocoris tenuis]
MSETLELDLSDVEETHQSLETERFVQLDGQQLSYQHFFREYLRPNRPCLLKNVTQDWVAQKRWVKDGKPNFSYLKEKYGNAEVPVSDCNERYFNSQKKCTMSMADFLAYWESFIDNGYAEDDYSYYMKDWHFANEHPSEDAYRVPPFFASDWINEYLLRGEKCSNDDYRFVYMGPKGTWTPLHSDVFSSFSWSVNICGKKKWLFLPPGSENCLKDKLGNLVYDVDDKELEDSNKYPNYSANIPKTILIQDVGDAVFVPSGWHHQVWNLDDTISFNHNWINGCNVGSVLAAMNSCLVSVSMEIEDCKDMDEWDDQCQLLLKSCFGMNHKDFYDFVTYISRERLAHLKEGSRLRVNGGWLLGPNHMKFDLSQIKALLRQMLNTDVPCYQSLKNEFTLLINEIDENI